MTAERRLKTGAFSSNPLLNKFYLKGIHGRY